MVVALIVEAARGKAEFLKRALGRRCIYEIFAGVISGLGTLDDTRVHGKPEKGEQAAPPLAHTGRGSSCAQ